MDPTGRVNSAMATYLPDDLPYERASRPTNTKCRMALHPMPRERRTTRTGLSMTLSFNGGIKHATPAQNAMREIAAAEFAYSFEVLLMVPSVVSMLGCRVRVPHIQSREDSDVVLVAAYR